MTTSHLNDGGLEGPTYPPDPIGSSVLAMRASSNLNIMSLKDTPAHVNAAAAGATVGRVEVMELEESFGRLCPSALTSAHVPEGLPTLPKVFEANAEAFMNGFAAEWMVFGRRFLHHSFQTLPREPFGDAKARALRMEGMFLLVESVGGNILPRDLAKRVFNAEEVHPYPDYEEVTGQKPNSWTNTTHAFRLAIDCRNRGYEIRTMAEEEKRRKGPREHGSGYFPGAYVLKETLDAALKWEHDREALVSKYLRGISVWEGARMYCIERGLIPSKA